MDSARSGIAPKAGGGGGTSGAAACNKIAGLVHLFEFIFETDFAFIGIDSSLYVMVMSMFLSY